MGDYAPQYAPGEAITYTTSGVVVGGQLLFVSGSGTVAKTAGATPSWVGVAAYDAASGEKVTIRHGGVQKLVASGAITAGDLLVSAANGAVSTLAAVTTPTAADVNGTRQVVGVAMTTAADTALVEVFMER